MPTWLNWLIDEWAHIQEFWKLAAVLVLLAAVGGWQFSKLPYKTQISNLQSEVALLKSQLATADDSVGPLPMYSLGGSNVLIYNSRDWTPQDTAKKVELDWDRLTDLEAFAILRMRTEGDAQSTWVQARIVNMTNSEIVGNPPA